MWAITTPKEKREAKLALAPVVASLTSEIALNVPRMPKMPTMSPDGKLLRRDKPCDTFGFNGLATVARSVKPIENKKAIAVMEKEWSSLREVGAWDKKRVREWTDVRDEAKKKGVRIHVRIVFGICFVFFRGGGVVLALALRFLAP